MNHNEEKQFVANAAIFTTQLNPTNCLNEDFQLVNQVLKAKDIILRWRLSDQQMRLWTPPTSCVALTELQEDIQKIEAWVDAAEEAHIYHEPLRQQDESLEDGEYMVGLTNGKAVIAAFTKEPRYFGGYPVFGGGSRYIGKRYYRWSTWYGFSETLLKADKIVQILEFNPNLEELGWGAEGAQVNRILEGRAVFTRDGYEEVR